MTALILKKLEGTRAQALENRSQIATDETTWEQHTGYGFPIKDDL